MKCPITIKRIVAFVKKKEICEKCNKIMTPRYSMTRVSGGMLDACGEVYEKYFCPECGYKIAGNFGYLG